MSCKSRLIGVASVHSRMNIPLAHSTSADMHSVFMRLRLRFDSRHVAYVVHHSNGLYRRTSAETAWIRHACASRGTVDQRAAAVEAVSDKSFRTPPSSKVETGACAGTRGKTCFRKSRRQLHRAVLDLPTSRIRARTASPPPKYTLGPHACASNATQAMLMAGRSDTRARDRAHGDPHP